MSPRQNASADSAPDRAGDWRREILLRRGTLACDGEPYGDVVCLDAEGSFLVLAYAGAALPDITGQGAPGVLRFSNQAGILHLPGILRRSPPPGSLISGVARGSLLFEVQQDGVKRLNRRHSYRVAVSLKGELIGVSRRSGSPREGNAVEPLDSLSGQRLAELAEGLASRARPCLVHDLSLGGARLSVVSPAPAEGEEALLHLKLGIDRNDTLRNLPCVVVQRREENRATQESNFVLRIQFHRLGGAAEGRLGRFLARVQLKHSKTGVRR